MKKEIENKTNETVQVPQIMNCINVTKCLHCKSDLTIKGKTGTNLFLAECINCGTQFNVYVSKDKMINEVKP